MNEVRIERFPAMVLAGLSATFISALSGDTTAPQTIGPLWGRFIERAPELPAKDPGVFYGWSHCLPPDARSREDELGYVACLEVEPGAALPDGVVTVEAPEGLYAVFEHHGPMDGFHDLVLHVYREWLPNSPYRGNGKGDLERYDSRWNPMGEDSVFEFRVGIEPR